CWWLDKLCSCQSRGPVPKLPLRGGNGRLIAVAKGGLVCRRKTINRPLNRGQTFGRDEVRMRGDGTIWQLYRPVIFGFFNKRATHNNSAFPVVTGRRFHPKDAPPA